MFRYTSPVGSVRAYSPTRYRSVPFLAHANAPQKRKRPFRSAPVRRTADRQGAVPLPEWPAAELGHHVGIARHRSRRRLDRLPPPAACRRVASQAFVLSASPPLDPEASAMVLINLHTQWYVVSAGIDGSSTPSALWSCGAPEKWHLEHCRRAPLRESCTPTLTMMPVGRGIGRDGCGSIVDDERARSSAVLATGGAARVRTR